MGISGYGILDNDRAADHLDTVIRQLLDEAQAIMDDPAKLADDLNGQGYFIPNIAMVVALTKDLDYELPFDAEEIKMYRSWRMRYTDAFEQQKRKWPVSYYWPRSVVIDQVLRRFNGCFMDDPA